MAFASWFELIPRLKNFRPLICAGPNLTIEEGLKGCAWRLTVVTFIRLLLLATWGVSSIYDFEDDIIRSKLGGLWLEFLVLATLLGIAVIMMLVSWQMPAYYLNGCIVAIPILCLFDFSIKATCYEVLFFQPNTTAFGVISMVEFWFRYASLSHTWLMLVTFIKEALDKPNMSYMTNGDIINNRNSQIVRRNNSSIWEKPSFTKQRPRTPQLEQISENTESYSRSESPSRRSRSRRSRPPSHSRPPSRQSQRNSLHQSEKERYSQHYSDSEHRSSVRNSMIRQSSHGPSIQHIEEEEEIDNYGFEPQNEIQSRSSYRSRPKSRLSYHKEEVVENEDDDGDDATYDDPYEYREPMFNEMDDPEDIPPPPPRTRPQWREPSSGEYHDNLVVNNRHVASRQTSQTSSINALRRNWEGATDWRNPKQNLGRINSDTSDMMYKNESPLI